MPYTSNNELPVALRHCLPPRAQDIYREAFNSAYASYAHDPRQDEIARRIAWSAVKRFYTKIGVTWVARPAHRRGFNHAA